MTSHSEAMTPPDPVKCKTCGGVGLIGGLQRWGDGEVDSIVEPCPDCATPDPAARVAFTHQWTDRDDRFLLYWGYILEIASGGDGRGYRFVCEHDLHVDPEEGFRRLAWLRESKSGLVTEMEKEAEREEI